MYALNVCSGYRTESKEATLVIVGTPSLPLLTRIREERHGGAE